MPAVAVLPRRTVRLAASVPPAARLARLPAAVPSRPADWPEVKGTLRLDALAPEDQQELAALREAPSVRWPRVRALKDRALAIAFLASLGAPGRLAEAALAAQLALYALAGLGLLLPRRAGRAAALCLTFVALNAAAVAGLVAWLRGRASPVWVRTGELGTM